MYVVLFLLVCLAYGSQTGVDGCNKSPGEDTKALANSCALPLVTGRCRAMKRVWGYDHKRGKCRQFTYGGCGGNDNRFKTKQKCMTACKPKTPKTDCSKRPMCKMFCINGFQKGSDGCPICKCKPSVKDTKPKAESCNLPLETGRCRARKRVWGYDHKMGKCRQFTYGGCGGNDNRFKTKQTCLAACKPKTDCSKRPMCKMFCRNGFQKGSDGCPICKCSKTKDCSKRMMCAMFCLNGFQKGRDGCPICKCKTSTNDNRLQ